MIGSAQLAPGGGVVLELGEPREGVALALLRAIAAERSADAGEEERPASHGSVHLQTDDRAARRQGGLAARPAGLSLEATVVSAPRNGWIAVYDEVADRDPRQLARLGRGSSSTGLVVFTIGVEEATAVHYIAFERGRTLDEYLSVPDYRGPLPPGDAIALRANPTVVARLTGAHPRRSAPLLGRPRRPTSAARRRAAARGRAGAWARRDPRPLRRSAVPPRCHRGGARMKVVLLHAMPLDERMWSPQLPALADYEVETPNLYDLGGSSIDEWTEKLLEQ